MFSCKEVVISFIFSNPKKMLILYSNQHFSSKTVGMKSNLTETQTIISFWYKKLYILLRFLPLIGDYYEEQTQMAFNYSHLIENDPSQSYFLSWCFCDTLHIYPLFLFLINLQRWVHNKAFKRILLFYFRFFLKLQCACRTVTLEWCWEPALLMSANYSCWVAAGEKELLYVTKKTIEMSCHLWFLLKWREKKYSHCSI